MLEFLVSCVTVKHECVCTVSHGRLRHPRGRVSLEAPVQLVVVVMLLRPVMGVSRFSVHRRNCNHIYNVMRFIFMRSWRVAKCKYRCPGTRSGVAIWVRVRRAAVGSSSIRRRPRVIARIMRSLLSHVEPSTWQSWEFALAGRNNKDRLQNYTFTCMHMYDNINAMVITASFFFLLLSISRFEVLSESQFVHVFVVGALQKKA